MAEASTRIDTMKNWVSDHRKPLMAIVALIAVIVLIIGLSLTWFVNNKSLSTVGKVQMPATLKVLGPNQSAIEQIDLSYSNTADSTVTDDNKEEWAVVRRGFCVQSDGSNFELQVANTTNISGLEIKVYRVKNANAEAKDATIAGVSGTNTYSWQIGDEVTGWTFLNLADGENNHADASKYDDQTFKGYGEVQKNARSLYRSKTFSGANELYKEGDVSGVATNFIIECKWKTKPNVKETDVVYLIARSAN